MREIKFRAWDAIAKKYFTGQGMVLECLQQQLTGEYDHCKDGMVFEQFTGFHDRYGVEIFEGDVVRRKTQHECRWNDYIPPEAMDIEEWTDPWRYYKKYSMWQTGKITMTPEVRFNGAWVCGHRSGDLPRLENFEYREVKSEYDYEVTGNIHESVVK